MKIAPDEEEIVGKIVIREGSAVLDDTGKRVESLTSSCLQRIGVDASGWDCLYRDPADGCYWERTYPKSDMHGGGPPKLQHISIDVAELKYPQLQGERP